MNRQALGLILLTGMALGSSVVMTRFALAQLSPLALIMVRLALATLAFILILAMLGRSLPRDERTWIAIAMVGISQALSLLLFISALQFISSAVLTIFIALIPLFTGLLAHLFLPNEKLNAAKLIGLGVALAGVLYLILTRTTGIANAAGLDLSGFLLALGGGITAAASTVYTRLRLRGVDVMVVTGGQFAAGLLAVAPVSLGFSSVNLLALDLRGWFAVVYTAMIGSLAGFFLMFYMIRRFGATISVLPGYVMPVVSASLGALLLGEIVTLPLIGGAGLILMGVFLASR